MTLRRLAPLTALFVLGLTLGAQTGPTYTVSTAKELVQRLGPNRTIVLKKGDYRLSEAYQLKGGNFEWLDGEDGKELMVKNADNLSLKGQDGARILTSSLKSYLIGFYDSSSVSIENLAFVRETKGDETPEAGLFYAETVGKLSLSKVSLGGPSGFPLELWACEEVRLSDVDISGGVDGGLSLGQVGSFTATGGQVSRMAGFPLIYVEQSGEIGFDGTLFSDDNGGNFLENWEGEGEAARVSFSNCRFENLSFDYFVGNSNLPETLDCSYVDSSFDADWADYAVDTSSDQSYGSYDAYLETHSDEESGLSFDYPSGWEYEEGPGEGQAIIYSGDTDAVVFFAKALPLDASFDPAKDGPRLVSTALDKFGGILKEVASLDFQAEESRGLTAWEDGQMAEYRGSLSSTDGSTAPARLRLVLREGGVWALLVLSSDESLLEDEGELGQVLQSLTTSAGD